MFVININGTHSFRQTIFTISRDAVIYLGSLFKKYNVSKTAKKNEIAYNRKFVFDCFRMIMRYDTLGGDSLQWAHSDINNLIDAKTETTTLELFASPINNVSDIYCSLFLDTDKPFGSAGSFPNNIPSIKDGFTVLCNPPYIEKILNDAAMLCLKLLNEYQIQVAFTCPKWIDMPAYIEMSKSKYLVKSSNPIGMRSALTRMEITQGMHKSTVFHLSSKKE